MLRNTTRKKIVIQEMNVLSSPWAKGLGLMFRLSSPKYGVVFPFSPPTRAGIHMWFVFFSLDIAWLDERGIIQEMRTLRPWSFHTPKKKCSYVVELPAGTLARSQTKIGDKCDIKNSL